MVSQHLQAKNVYLSLALTLFSSTCRSLSLFIWLSLTLTLHLTVAHSLSISHSLSICSLSQFIISLSGRVGEIYSWGRAERGQCGHLATSTDIVHPRVVDAFFGAKVVDVACGLAHSVVRLFSSTLISNPLSPHTPILSIFSYPLSSSLLPSSIFY